MRKHKRLWDTYRYPGFRPSTKVYGIFGDPKARVIELHRREKKRLVVPVGMFNKVGTIARSVELEICHAEIIASTWIWKSVA